MSLQARCLQINSQLHSNTRWLLYSLASLTPVFREVEALIYLSLSPHLARPIMDPFGEASLQTQQREWIPEGPPEASAKNTDLCVSQAKAAYGLNPSQVGSLKTASLFSPKGLPASANAALLCGRRRGRWLE